MSSSEEALAANASGSVPVSVPASTSGSGSAYEVLACVACRARKLKCDRVKPACSRCRPDQCVYPESRRKPVVKRRNVRELEQRLGGYPRLICEIGANIVY